MRKNTAWLLTAFLLFGLILSPSGVLSAEGSAEDPVLMAPAVCRLDYTDGTPSEFYATIQEGFLQAVAGQDLVLLQDVTLNQRLSLAGTDCTLVTNGFDLSVVVPDGLGMDAFHATVRLDDSGGGGFYVTGTGRGAMISNFSDITLSSVECLPNPGYGSDNVGAYVREFSNLNVQGNVQGVTDGLYIATSSTATIGGDVVSIAGKGIQALSTGAITVEGDVVAETEGIYHSGTGQIHTKGNITSKTGTAIQTECDDPSNLITVDGNVTVTGNDSLGYEWGIFATRHSNVIVKGSVTSAIDGVKSWQSAQVDVLGDVTSSGFQIVQVQYGGQVNIGGSLVSTDLAAEGVYVNNAGTVTIDGSITTDPDQYIFVAEWLRREGVDDSYRPTMKTGYYTYTDDSLENRVFVKKTVVTPGALQFEAGSYGTYEGYNGYIWVERLDGDDEKVTVDYASVDGTAIGGTHYNTLSGTLTWQDGDRDRKYIPFTVYNDSTYNGYLNLTVELSNPTGGATLGAQNPLSVQLSDNDTPLAPTGLTATAGDQEVVLEWDEIKDTYYRVYYSTESGNFNETDKVSVYGKTTYTFEGLDNQTTYYFMVKAVHNIYPSLASEEVSATPFTTYTVAFDANGGSSVEARMVAHGDLLPSPADPAKEGYTFLGWYVDEDLTQLWDFATETVVSNNTLYAGWETIPPAVAVIKTDDETGVEVQGIEDAVTIPEEEMEGIKEVEIYVAAKEILLKGDLLAEVEDQLEQQGYSLLTTLNIQLRKIVKDYEGIKKDLLVENKDITGDLTVRIPLTEEQAAMDDLAIAYVDGDGNVSILTGMVETVGDKTYFTFETDHFSIYALVEATRPVNPATGTAGSMGLGMLASLLGLAGLGMVLWRKRK
ncbi:InlB B-repeat-containing protein [Alkalibacter rhizosphaerae]|uniref:InlB B-repeat-containing protein n=1 Tax=Alkalibacter rhizosphaerae TaxID=2815577 RepID=A0A974XNS4_9FIRM|nr:InlB B-repeat-containing protein [Alkalibacter rhizosphaerae]QSX09256.1 InlB B-repeat-containing protein [Alkalibacter rhizosphaerae]